MDHMCIRALLTAVRSFVPPNLVRWALTLLATYVGITEQVVKVLNTKIPLATVAYLADQAKLAIHTDATSGEVGGFLLVIVGQLFAGMLWYAATHFVTVALIIYHFVEAKVVMRHFTEWVRDLRSKKKDDAAKVGDTAMPGKPGSEPAE